MRGLATVFALALGACGSPDEPTKPIGVSDLARDGGSLEDALGLLALGESGYGGGGPAALADQGLALSEGELALFSRTAVGPWREWSDELVRFEIPDDPLVVVTRVTPAQAALLRVVGSFVGTTDHRFERAYRITVGEEIPYGLVLVSRNEWFDEGICFCGPVVRKTFRCADGNLLEFSQLPDGAVKKVQAINGTHRAILFEWTHSALTREAYSRIAASLRLVEPSARGAADWHALTRERRGKEAGFGWLRLGMDRGEVVALFGEPDRTETDRLVYVREERWDGGWGGFETRTLAFHGGKLAPLEEDWFETGELPALEASVAWALEVAEKAKDDQGKPSPVEIDRVFAEFAGQGPEAKEHWNSWCRAVYELHENGHEFEAVLPLVEARFLEPDLEGHYAAHLLSKYESAQLQPLAKRRIDFLLGESASSEQRSSELSNLYGFLDADAEALDLIRRGVGHDDAEPRRAAAWMIHRLAKPEARDAVRALLSDSDEFVRSAAASRAERVCEAGDLAWLEQARENETEERIRKNLEGAIQSIGKGMR